MIEAFRYIYMSVWGCQGLLWGNLMYRRAHKTYPAFVVLTNFYLLQMIVLGVLFLVHSRYYSLIYWNGRTISMVICVFVAGEIVQSLKVTAVGLALYIGVIIAGPHLWVYRWAGFALFCFMAVSTLLDIDRERKAIATGMAIQILAGAIGDLPQVIGNETLRYIPTIGYILAQGVWIHGLLLRTKEEA